MGAPSVELVDVTAGYGGEPVFERLSLSLRGPGLVVVIGPNGAGKTTLFRVVLGLLAPKRGRVLVNGVDVTGRPGAAGRMVGYVPQSHDPASHVPVTVREFVELALVAGPGARGAAGRVDALLEELGLADVADRPLRELSGGQRQRALIARALARDPPVVLMDEPLAAVDPKGRMRVARVVAGLARGRLVVVSGHDPGPFLGDAGLLVLLNRRVVAAGRPEEVLRLSVLREVYGESAMRVRECVHLVDEHVR